MVARDSVTRPDPAITLPAFERLGAPPPPDLVASAIEGHSSPGDVVVDLHGRGGWVARAAVDRQRRAVSMESNPLTRLLAEIVLRPPDVRHLDAAFQALGAAPRGQSSLRVSIGDTFATRCPTCGRSAVVDEFIWEAQGEGDDDADGGGQDGDDVGEAVMSSAAPDSGSTAAAASQRWAPRGRLLRKHYRCIVCRDQLGGGEQRHAPIDDDDLDRAESIHPRGHAWHLLHERFPTLDGHDQLVDQLLDLHSPRQLDGLQAILDRIDTDLRSASVEAALRLSLLHALLPASRLNGFPGRIANVRIHGGRVKLPAGDQWRERNPWLAFEDGYRVVRGFVQRLEGNAFGPAQARLGDDVRSLGEGVATAVVRLGTASAFRSLETEAREAAGSTARPRVRLVVGQPPQRPNQDRLSYAYLATGWLLGREAAALLPLESLFGAGGRAPWGWQAAALGRSLAAVEPWLARDARVVLFLEAGGPEALVAAALGGVRAGFRLVGARLGEPGDEVGGIVEFIPPGGTLAPPPRTRANIGLAHTPGGTGDPDVVPGRGLFAAPERFDRRPFSGAEAAQTVADTAVEILQARGEPARQERLLGEVLVGMDRAGMLRRLVAPPTDDVPGVPADRTNRPPAGEAPPPGPAGLGDPRDRIDRGGDPIDRAPRGEPGIRGGIHERPDLLPDRPERPDRPDRAERAEPVIAPRGLTARPRRDERREPATLAGNDQVETVLAVIRDELGRADQKRLVEIEPGRWWLAEKADIAAAAVPLADRVEWAVFSLLSTAGRLSEPAFFDRIARLFTGHDLPDEALVRACLASYRSLASTTDRLVTGDDLLKRSQEHTELLALLAETGHRLGYRVWLSEREQTRRLGGRPLASWLDQRELNAYLPLVSHGAAEEVEAVDAIWYVRSRGAYLFEVEWTAMLAEPILRRHARIPSQENLVRILVIAPERTELVRYKLERSPLLRQAIEAGNWHLIKANHFRTWAAHEELELGELEPFIGLDPLVERSGEQMPLFGGAGGPTG